MNSCSLPYGGLPDRDHLPGQRSPWTQTLLGQTESNIIQSPPVGQTNASENITLPQTSFAGGNKKFFNFETAYHLELLSGYFNTCFAWSKHSLLLQSI